MHYTTIGQPVVDQTQIGVVLAKEPPAKLRATGGGQIPNIMFAIPPGDPNYEVVARQTINRDTYLSTMYPHMHVRGKDVSYTIVYPDGREEVVLQRAEVRLQLAVELPAGRAEVHAQGIDARDSRALRQLEEQSVQSRSERRPCAGANRPGKRC